MNIMRTTILLINYLLFGLMACRQEASTKGMPVFITAETTQSVRNIRGGMNAPNLINNAEGLYPLRSLMNNAGSGQTVINVLHIGDSHIKSGLYSQPFMKSLNRFYAKRYNNKLFFNFQWFCKIGTKYADYNDLAELEQQLIATPPDMVIISLGTNDAFSGASRNNFYEQVDRMVQKIITLAPNAVLLITTPPGAMKMNAARGRYEAMPELETAVSTIIQYCNNKKIPYWNLFGIMGGSYAVNSWVQQKLTAPDHVHYTAKGYALFSGWLFDAFTKAIS